MVSNLCAVAHRCTMKDGRRLKMIYFHLIALKTIICLLQILYVFVGLQQRFPKFGPRAATRWCARSKKCIACLSNFFSHNKDIKIGYICERVLVRSMCVMVICCCLVVVFYFFSEGVGEGWLSTWLEYKRACAAKKRYEALVCASERQNKLNKFSPGGSRWL